VYYLKHFFFGTFLSVSHFRISVSKILAIKYDDPQNVVVTVAMTEVKTIDITFHAPEVE
jgi:hypothetical protein